MAIQLKVPTPRTVQLEHVVTITHSTSHSSSSLATSLDCSTLDLGRAKRCIRRVLLYTTHAIGRILSDRELVTITDYRTRLALYRTDSALVSAHASAPWITVWDDHEVANNGWKAGTSDSNDSVATGGCAFSPSLTCFTDRKNAAVRAYHEWMPIRQVAADDKLGIWRNFRIGKLLDLTMLDTRNYDRDVTDDGWNRALVATLADQPQRSIMGHQDERAQERRGGGLQNALKSAEGTFQRQICIDVLANATDAFNIDLRSSINCKLKAAHDSIARTLSSQQSTKLEIKSFEGGNDLSETLTRAKFEELNGRCQAGVYLRGRACRWFYPYPQGPGGVLSGKQGTDNIVLIDVNPLALGIETTGGAFTKLILRNTDQQEADLLHRHGQREQIGFHLGASLSTTLSICSARSRDGNALAYGNALAAHGQQGSVTRKAIKSTGTRLSLTGKKPVRRS
ncbi:hypothetical protein EXIGLDRAFT_768193 [Exidia glandulosa HHB12029]|uniref:PhoD-like phosphatase metallophosphatase domain-containing protein n=1 Tax=Exidia glandulosa HHB12029 TaxID=1314781 RepID=A0A165IEK0_EXIGL|nr:hypothetical protein EXIGLDRAFT_768193 [Exidia glandulosa HHB12029]